MKRSFFSFLLLFAFSAFFATTALAGDPIPGVGVGAGKNPGGQLAATAKTVNDGSFTLNLKEGTYDITVQYSEVQAAVKRLGKTCSEVTLSLDAGGNKRVLANGRAMPSETELTASAKPITITVPAGGATISGTLTGDMAAATSAKTQEVKKKER